MVRLLMLVVVAGCAPHADPPTDEVPPIDTAAEVDPAWICATDDEVCDGVCTATRFDPLSCGSCGHACDDAEVCDEGTCRPPAVAPACDEATRAAVLAEATADQPSVELNCSLTLDAADVVTKAIRLVGAEASGVTMDCQGARLSRTIGAAGPDTVLVASRKVGEASWERPTDVTIRDCHIEGSIRVQGQGSNGEAADVRTDSHTEGHRERAQLAAPTRVWLEGLTVVADGRIPVYLSPGTTAVTLRGSLLQGRVVSTVVYLDAESGHHHLVDNVFDAVMEGSPLRREVLAVDGSADNVIAGNTFRQPIAGGIFVYRNCGEGGTVRHQEPRRNLITGNRFEHPAVPFPTTIWVGSRVSAGLPRSYCSLDDGFGFGSSANDEDRAKNTVVVGNRFAGAVPDPLVKVDDGPTIENDNAPSQDATAGAAHCAIFRHERVPRVLDDGARAGGRVCREGRRTPEPH